MTLSEEKAARLHAYLDGELDAGEREIVERWLATDDAAAGYYLAICQVAEGLAALPKAEFQMAAADPREQLPVGGRRRFTGFFKWLKAPVPAWGVAVVLALALGPWILSSPRGGVPVKLPQPVALTAVRPAPATATTIYVRLLLNAPQAQAVAVTGDFNRWSPKGLVLTDVNNDGVWEVMLPLSPGRYAYQFVVDGAQMIPDPHAGFYQPDGFGGKNSLLEL